ncbi:rna helicase [Nannochloropsis oceanica]
MEVPVVGKTTPYTATTTLTAASAPADDMMSHRLPQHEQQQQQEEDAAQSWNSDPRAALDLGVITTFGSIEEVEEETYVPKGYEGAPAIILSMHKHMLGEEGGEDEDEKGQDNGEGMLNRMIVGEGKREKRKRSQPSCVSRSMRIINEAPGPYLLREVLILPRDEKCAALWVEVEVGGRVYSSKTGLEPFLRERSPGKSTAPAVGTDSLLVGGITEGCVSVLAMPGTESSTVKKWVLLRVEGPGVGPAHDLLYHSFVVARKVVATVVDASAQSLLNVEARPFVPRALKQYFDAPYNVIFAHPSTPPPFQPKGMASVLQALPQHFLSKNLQTRLAAYKAAPAGSRGDPYVFFNVTQNPKTVGDYCGNMQAMLFLEEAQTAEDIKRYDLFGVPIIYQERPVGRLDMPLVATITVPGASEKRPPLAYGDEVLLRPACPPSFASGGEKVIMEIRAAVLETKEERVKLLLPSNFPTETLPSESRFHVRFTYDRYGYRFLHQALQHFMKSATQKGREMTSAGHCLFPCADGEGEAEGGKEETEVEGREGGKVVVAEEGGMRWVNSLINKEQRQAVMDIVNRTHGRLPYILYGPPGTGKTLTVIEAILQICRHHPEARVLAVAPSDVAADILAERLAEYLTPTRLFRLNWYQRLTASMKPALLRYSCWDPSSSLFSLPANDPCSILARQVIVSTCATSGILSLLQRPGQPLISFTHILVDEASQALQPEVMVPLSFAGPDTGVVLAGDPKQLGAITRNPLVQELGLAQSLQERLMETRAVYSVPHTAAASTAAANEDGGEGGRSGHGRCLLMLFRNYRSHQAIIEVPSRLFYSQTLEQHGDESLINSCLSWEMLPGSSSATARGMSPYSQAGGGGFPILFWGCLGDHMHELDSPSFFNVVECGKVLEMVQALLGSKKVQVRLQDIAIISAFRKQVLKLRSLLRENGYGAINVGQVEDFQGQETKVVIISTVLSGRHPNEVNEQLGFLGHPKRFNVAITRAQALTVIVGNPYALWEDVGGWRQLLEFCAAHGAVRGSSGPLGTPDVESVESLLDAIANESLLGKASSSDIYPTQLEDYFSDSPWRLLL